MFRLSLQIILILFSIASFAQTPHGDDFDEDCSLCHTSDDWKVDLSQVDFDHSTTNFNLIGQHNNVDCRSCHTSLVFSAAKEECYSCHKDIHQGSVGFDCANCHSPTSWVVKDIIRIHQTSRFPLVGAHKSADCSQCHSNYSELRFDILQVDCYSCHVQDYNSARAPDHIAANFSKECQDCHNISSTSWRTTNIDHNFFPLVGGHSLPNCFSCHQQNTFSGLSTECYSCHQSNYQATQSPNHISAGIPTTCEVCHSINGWIPAQFNHSLTQFPLTGKHIDVNCSDCHTSGYSGTPTECYACHQQDYENVNDPNHVQSQFPTDCTLCHSTAGWEGAVFDHNLTQFPLTGSHVQVNCASCHSNGYTGTPTDCWSCHQNDYQSTTDPNHALKGYSQDCTQCHNTGVWSDVNFDHNTTQFPLTGQHTQANCSDCHTSGYTGTSTVCSACHQTDYNNTTNPNHFAAGFPNTCEDCHTTNGWHPASFDHDNQYFPIYSGEHSGKWNTCSDCHTIANNFAVFSCIGCHEHNKPDMDDKHQGVQGYVYNSADCFACHPTGEKDGAFNHATSNFVLVGVHLSTDCIQCHQNGYSGTSAICSDCHLSNYNSTVNPNHQILGLSTDCSTCHTPTADWQPALFPQHDQVFQLVGAHLQIANNCSACHNGNYNTTTNQCVGCHQNAYTASVNPNHGAAGIPTNCENCHTSNAWIPSTFDHATTGFALVGSHQPIQCSSCHVGTVTGLNNQCISCHQDQYNSAPNHTSQSFPTNCEMCHNSVAWNEVTFDHQNTAFPLTGAHTNTDCQQCHSAGYSGTSTLCYSCHQNDYQQSANPNHAALSLATTCETCHTTNPGWAPATFAIHNNFYQLLGAHLQVNNCNDCHQGNYNSTPNTCMGCHSANFNGTLDPPHQQLNFSEDCLSCHTMNGWTPANFNHNFFPLGNDHSNVDCNECHSETNYQPQCLSCHLEDFLDEHNPGDPTDCWTCHNTNNWDQGMIKPHIKRLE